MKYTKLIPAILLVLACFTGIFVGRQFERGRNAGLRESLGSRVTEMENRQKKIEAYLKSAQADRDRMLHDNASSSQSQEAMAKQVNAKMRQHEIMLAVLETKVKALIDKNEPVSSALKNHGERPEVKDKARACAQKAQTDLGDPEETVRQQESAEAPVDLSGVEDEDLRKDLEKTLREALAEVKEASAGQLLKGRTGKFLAKVLSDGAIDVEDAGLLLSDLNKSDRAISKAINSLDDAVEKLRKKRQEIERRPLISEQKQAYIEKIDKLIDQLEGKKSDLRDLQTKLRISQAVIGALLALGCAGGNAPCCGAIIKALLDMQFGGDIRFNNNKRDGGGDTRGDAEGKKEPQSGTMMVSDLTKPTTSKLNAEGGDVTVTLQRGKNGYNEVRFTLKGGREQIALTASNQDEHNLIEHLREAGVVVRKVGEGTVVYSTNSHWCKLFNNGGTIMREDAN